MPFIAITVLFIVGNELNNYI